jgi:Peptidase family M48
MMRTMEEHRKGQAMPDWGQDRVSVPGVGARVWRLVALFGFIPVVLLILLLTGVPPLVVAALMALYWLGVASWLRAQGARVLRAVGARVGRPEEVARLENLVQGLADDLEITTPELLVTDEPGPNALVAKRSGHIVVVTADLAREFSRTELEAVLAHCFVRIATDQVGTAQVGLALGPLGAGLRGLTGVAEDVAAAGLTRYPPALISAIEKCEPRSGRFAALWFVADGPSHAPVDRRISDLRDL